MNITKFQEALYHFNCEYCKKWWSIGDWIPTKTMWCPHCGKRSEVVESE